MKKMSLISLIAAALSAAVAAEPPGQLAPRVGIYDSRAVAYAFFQSAPCRRERDTLIAEAKAAKAAGATARLGELEQRIVATQKQITLEVFRPPQPPRPWPSSGSGCPRCSASLA